MGINFSRVLTLKYGYNVKHFLNQDRASDLGRPCHDLCAWHGRGPRTGDP